MEYKIRYIEKGVDVTTDSNLLGMLLETDKIKLKELSDNCMCKYTKVDDDGRAYIQIMGVYYEYRGDYAYTFKTVECDSFEDVFAKCNKILHKGAIIVETETGFAWTVMQQGMEKRDLEHWEENYKTINVGEFLTLEGSV